MNHNLSGNTNMTETCAGKETTATVDQNASSLPFTAPVDQNAASLPMDIENSNSQTSSSSSASPSDSHSAANQTANFQNNLHISENPSDSLTLKDICKNYRDKALLYINVGKANNLKKLYEEFLGNAPIGSKKSIQRSDASEKVVSSVEKIIDDLLVHLFPSLERNSDWYMKNLLHFLYYNQLQCETPISKAQIIEQVEVIVREFVSSKLDR